MNDKFAAFVAPSRETPGGWLLLGALIFLLLVYVLITGLIFLAFSLIELSGGAADLDTVIDQVMSVALDPSTPRASSSRISGFASNTSCNIGIRRSA